jgi:hypothetical protein
MTRIVSAFGVFLFVDNRQSDSLSLSQRAENHRIDGLKTRQICFAQPFSSFKKPDRILFAIGFETLTATVSIYI